MPYTIVTKDNIEIRNIPDSVPRDSPELKARVAQERQKLAGQAAFGAPPQLGPDGQVIQQPAPAAPPAAPQPSMGEQFMQSVANIPQTLVGAAETAGTLATGATTGPMFTLGNTLKQIASELLQGRDIAEPQAQERIRQAAERGMQAGTYVPQTQAGQQIAGAVGQALAPVGEAMLPLTPMMGSAPAALPSARAALPAAAAVTQEVIPEVVVAAKRLPGMGSPAPDSPALIGRSVGAAETPAVTQRIVTAQSLPVPVTLTRGAATREAGQLAFEKEMVKSPQMGEPLRVRAEQNNLELLQNLDTFIDQTGAVMGDRPAVGRSVTRALLEGYGAAKARTKAAYTRAFQSDGAQETIDLTKAVTTEDNGAQISTTLFDYLNSRPKGLPSTGVFDAARSYAQNLGLATVDDAGNLVPNENITVAQMEKFRQEVSSAVGADPTDKRAIAVVKRLIDDTVGDSGGDAFRNARATRKAQARKYENRAVVARLVEEVGGRTDMKVMSDEVFRSAIANSSPEEITFLKRVLNTSGRKGQQAWRELQGATVREIQDTAVAGGQTDSQGRQIISVAKFNAQIDAMNRSGQLEAIFGKTKAQQINDLNEVARYVTTVPPGTLINNSGTAGTILWALAEVGGQQMLTGVPAPVASVLRLIYKNVQDKKIKAAIQRSLNARGE